jgi:hypothetical protein
MATKTDTTNLSGAMPGAKGGSRKPDPSKMADEIEMIKELVDAAFMAANDLVDFQRGAMRGLLGQTSEKIGKVAEEFTDAYCGGNVDPDVVADMLNVARKAAPDPIARQAEPASSSPRPPLSSELLDVVDEINHVRYAIHAVWMASAHLDRDDHNAMQGVLGPALDRLTAARDRLDKARGAPEWKAA